VLYIKNEKEGQDIKIQNTLLYVRAYIETEWRAKCVTRIDEAPYKVLKWTETKKST
jgi:hypothetical protein